MINNFLRKLLTLTSGFKLKGEFKVITTCSKTGALLRETEWEENQIVANSGKGVYILLDLLADITTYTGKITHMELGDDNTAATSADTALGNGLERVALLSASTVRSGLQVTFKAFFPDATTADDTYEEVGTYIDGAAGLGTGRLWSRIIFGSPLVKAAGEDNTIVYRVTATV